MKLEKENILTTLSQSILFKDIEKYKIEQLIENSQKDFFKKGEIISEEELQILKCVLLQSIQILILILQYQIKV